MNKPISNLYIKVREMMGEGVEGSGGGLDVVHVPAHFQLHDLQSDGLNWTVLQPLSLEEGGEIVGQCLRSLAEAHKVR